MILGIKMPKAQACGEFPVLIVCASILPDIPQRIRMG
jgi:hypothetical protein